jgi:uncharacterized protein (TIGR00369 family)
MALDDEQIRELLRDPSKHPACARHLGFELIDFSVDGGWAEVAFMPRPEFANPQGSVQGGFVCAMLDDAMGVTASISQRFAILVPTLQISVSYLRPTPMSRVIGRGEVLAHGRLDGAPTRRPASARRHAAGHRHRLRRVAAVPETGVKDGLTLA